MTASDTALLRAQGISKDFIVRGKAFTAVEAVDFSMVAGERLGLVGPSGSGKSTLALILAGLLAPTRGTVHFLGTNLYKDNDARHFRRSLQLAFQHSKGVLDPYMSVAELVSEPFRIHKIGPASTWQSQGLALLEQVGLTPKEAAKYPGQLSGGQYQRLVIARAIASHPRLVILDEPVSALDVSVQGQILNLILDLQKTYQMAYLLISHDHRVVARMCDRLLMMP